MKEYNIIYKFGDITDTIKARNKREALKIANQRMEDDKHPIDEEAYIYNVEVEEVNK